MSSPETTPKKVRRVDDGSKRYAPIVLREDLDSDSGKRELIDDEAQAGPRKSTKTPSESSLSEKRRSFGRQCALSEERSPLLMEEDEMEAGPSKSTENPSESTLSKKRKSFGRQSALSEEQLPLLSEQDEMEAGPSKSTEQPCKSSLSPKRRRPRKNVAPKKCIRKISEDDKMEVISSESTKKSFECSSNKLMDDSAKKHSDQSKGSLSPGKRSLPQKSDSPKKKHASQIPIDKMELEEAEEEAGPSTSAQASPRHPLSNLKELIESSVKAVTSSTQKLFGLSLSVRHECGKLEKAYIMVKKDSEFKGLNKLWYKVENTPAHQTHMHSMKIKDVLCFEFSARRAQSFNLYASHMLPMLGNCVKYDASNRCDKRCKCNLYNCEVCPHLYKCNCSDKFEGTEWCAHIHVANRMKLSTYNGHVCLYVQNNYIDLTMKRHLRAYLQGPKKMKKVQPNIYKEEFEKLRYSQRYYVKIETDMIQKSACQCAENRKCPLCEACLCRYTCNCQDYWEDKQVCEHIHNVCMQEKMANNPELRMFQSFRGWGKILLKKPTERQFLRADFIKQEHEFGFYTRIEDILEIENESVWRLCTPTGEYITTVKLHKQWPANCICTLGEVSEANMCMRCKICINHYTCQCSEVHEVGICRHMHSVERFRKSKKGEMETFEDQIADFQSTLQEYLEKYKLYEILPLRKLNSRPSKFKYDLSSRSDSD